MIPTESSFTSRLRSAAVAARIGLWLGVCFAVAFVTGLISHYAQAEEPFPAHPAWGYRVTQGLHVVSGTAAVPLLLVKLWAVYPRLFASRPRRFRAAVLALLERGSIAVLVAGSLLELWIGLMNVSQWYAWRFDFRATHYALGWIVTGALLVHVAVKLPVIRDALGAPIEATVRDRAGAVRPGSVGRRTVLRATWAAAAVAVVAGTTTAGTLPGLDRIALLSPRSRRSGVPINVTAQQAGVVESAGSADWRLTVRHGGATTTLDRAALEGLPQATHTLPIACVEGWSANGHWTGVPLRTLLDTLGVPRGRDVSVSSIQTVGSNNETLLPANFVDDPHTLLALMLDGEPLTLDHGFPTRLIAPDRPGTLQTKWVRRLEVL